MTDGDFSKEAFEFALKKTYQEFIETLTPETKPKAFILGGQPGAGKTGLQKIMSKLCNNNLIVINGDEFRELHPDFQKLQEKYGKDSVDYTGKFSGQMTESLIERLKKEDVPYFRKHEYHMMKNQNYFLSAVYYFIKAINRRK